MLTIIFPLLYLGGTEVWAQPNNNTRNAVNTYKLLYPETTASTTYVPRVINKVCLLKPMNGPCRAQIPMYYFKPEEMICEEFNWGGCQGNGNRYDTEEECMAACVQPNNTYIEKPKYCTLTFDYGMCFGQISRWYYDKVWKLCKERIYSGCGGNKNNFYTKKECETTCHYGLRYRKYLEAHGNGFYVNPSPLQLRSDGVENNILNKEEKTVERNTIIEHDDKT